LEYSPIFDSACKNATKNPIKPQWVKELKARQGEFVAAWSHKGRRLLRATVEIAGHRFRRTELSATLSLCGLPTLSHPLLIKMQPYLKSFSKTPQGTDLLVGTVHHELLHHYLKGRIPASSALLLKYKGETQRVRAHLHLLSLQKTTYLKLGWKKELQQVVSNPGNNDIKRAWNIVKAVGHGPFVKELRK
jgi:hypothetical protein